MDSMSAFRNSPFLKPEADNDRQQKLQLTFVEKYEALNLYHCVVPSAPNFSLSDTA